MQCGWKVMMALALIAEARTLPLLSETGCVESWVAMGRDRWAQRGGGRGEDRPQKLGHLRPLGCQRPPEAEVLEYPGAPDAARLHEYHVMGRRPAVFRGAALGFPARPRLSPAGHSQGWTDQALASPRFANLSVLVEVRHEDRTTEPRRATLGGFIASYRAAARDKESHRPRAQAAPAATLEPGPNSYIVSVTPEPLAAEVLGLPPITCSSYRKTLLETNMWLSAGDTVSTLHNDADALVNCVLEGEKHWVFIHPMYKPMLAMASRRYQQEGDHGGLLQRSDVSDINASAVDLDAFPEVAKVPWQGAVVKAGDCAFLPPGYLHQVTSPPGRNLATSFMFSPLFNASDWSEDSACVNATRALEAADRALGSALSAAPVDPRAGFRAVSPGISEVAELLPLRDAGGWASFASLPFAWKYSGHGSVPMGYQSPFEVAASIDALVHSRDERVSAAAFVARFVGSGGGPASTGAKAWGVLMDAAGAPLSAACNPALSSATPNASKGSFACQDDGPLCNFRSPEVSGAGRPWWCWCTLGKQSAKQMSQALLKRLAIVMDASHAQLAEAAEASRLRSVGVGRQAATAATPDGEFVEGADPQGRRGNRMGSDEEAKGEAEGEGEHYEAEATGDGEEDEDDDDDDDEDDDDEDDDEVVDEDDVDEQEEDDDDEADEDIEVASTRKRSKATTKPVGPLVGARSEGVARAQHPGAGSHPDGSPENVAYPAGWSGEALFRSPSSGSAVAGSPAGPPQGAAMRRWNFSAFWVDKTVSVCKAMMRLGGGSVGSPRVLANVYDFGAAAGLDDRKPLVDGPATQRRVLEHREGEGNKPAPGSTEWAEIGAEGAREY